MTPDEIKSAINGWCSYGTGIQIVEDRSDSGSALAIGLRVDAADGTGTVPVDVRLEPGGDRLDVSSGGATGVDRDRLRELIESRPALVRGGVNGDSAAVTARVYTDGLNRDSFIRAVEEVAKTRSLVDGIGGGSSATATTPRDDLGGQEFQSSTPSAQPEPWSPAASQSGAGSTLPAPSFGGAAAGQGAGYSPLSGQPAQPQPQPQPQAFAPTHTVPPQGMQAWAAPDPNGAVVATLGGGLPIQVTEIRGAWARVLCSNGWTGWVDGRIIGVAR